MLSTAAGDDCHAYLDSSQGSSVSLFLFCHLRNNSSRLQGTSHPFSLQGCSSLHDHFQSREKKRKEKTAPFGVNLMRIQV